MIFINDIIFVVCEIVVAVSVKEIGEYLLTNDLVGNDKFGVSLIATSNCDQSEVIQQADKVVVLGDVFSRESFLYLSSDKALRHKCLYD